MEVQGRCSGRVGAVQRAVHLQAAPAPAPLHRPAPPAGSGRTGHLFRCTPAHGGEPRKTASLQSSSRAFLHSFFDSPGLCQLNSSLAAVHRCAGRRTKLEVHPGQNVRCRPGQNGQVFSRQERAKSLDNRLTIKNVGSCLGRAAGVGTIASLGGGPRGVIGSPCHGRRWSLDVSR